VASPCLFPLHNDLQLPVPAGDYAGCSTLSTSFPVAAEVTFTAGDLVILRDGFRADSGATLTIEIDRALYPDAWVQDDTPDGEIVYATTFSVDATNLDLDATDRFYHFIAFDEQGNPEVRVGVKFDEGLGERRLFLEVFEDGGGVVSTEGLTELELPTEWHVVGVGVQRANKGELGVAYLCVDAAIPPGACAELSGLDNDTGAIDFVRWGAIDVPSGSALGPLDLDDFVSNPPFADGFETGFAAWAARSQP
jgi:hypothetical protein